MNNFILLHLIDDYEYNQEILINKNNIVSIKEYCDSPNNTITEITTINGESIDVEEPLSEISKKLCIN